VKPVGAILWCAALSAISAGAELQKGTLEAFQGYVRATEARLDAMRGPGHFLWADQSPERLRQLREGQILIQPWNGKGDQEALGGLIHDWMGAVFVPGATLERTLAWVQDYDRHKESYRPEVIDSRVLSHHGNDFKIYMRLRKKKVITVVLDTEHEVHYFPVDAKRWYSRSYSTRIQEVDDPGTPEERLLPAGDDHGFLWRLYSYWRFEERDGGVYLECQALSLTRDVPTGLGWLIEPIIRQLPRESLANTLRSTRDAILSKAAPAR
jgi:hypothetical protein